MTTARSLLFVPGDRPDRFARAATSGADLVVVDLEDAVAPERKDAARAAIDDAVREGLRPAVRINAVGTPWHADDLDLVRRHGLLVMLPKAEEVALSALDGLRVVALVETARGLLDAPRIAAHPCVDRLALGHLDLAAELGVSPDNRTIVDAARVQLLIASTAAGLPGPVDGVTAQLRDPEWLRADLAAATAVGCAGKLCIHPDQIAPVHAALAPDEDEIAWARRVLASADAGVSVVDDRMVDAPVLARARTILARTGEARTEGEHPS
ncbi:CoA ester lyase [Aeromicrobium sp. S22]|uniref:HpcH/HpaI aldolase/citrate lyase family protein n=1 Tax=Aeromicrobium sp. S22 TaxID=2662029 RepID=UPI00129D5E72|nr:CoA ester lyase [Aeromicrobium sp. S22]MRK02449.1 CoA ester lyase [Aeromicrobium sp. S22]